MNYLSSYLEPFLNAYKEYTIGHELVLAFVQIVHLCRIQKYEQLRCLDCIILKINFEGFSLYKRSTKITLQVISKINLSSYNPL